ncbi:hypothetical protein K2P56_02585 [Patescibacteria group bacterium]|nr:hypothetical protein [Patescibacteria group bacterium]
MVKIAIVALALGMLGGLAYVFFTSQYIKQTKPISESETVVDVVPTASDVSGATAYDPKTDAGTSNERRDLTVSYELKVVAMFPNVTKASARDVCAISAGAGTCAWGGEIVTQSSSLEEKVAAGAFSVSLSPDEGPLTFGLQYHIEVRDPTAVTPQYRMFVIHKDLLGRINGIHEARITAETSPRADAKVFEWYLEEKYITEAGTEAVVRLREGHYQIAVVDVATGRVSGLTKLFRIGSGSTYTSDTTKYAANTPLARSYWTGKGVFFDGAGGEDTINLVGDMNMYDIFKGVEFPGYTDTLIFLQGGSVVITVVNVENIGFDDVKLKTAELKKTLEVNGGALYRTKKFTP